MKSLKQIIEQIINGDYNLADSDNKQVFTLKSDHNKIIKFGENAIEEGKIFKKFPQFCPKIYEINIKHIPPYVIMEKLDAEKARQDYEKFIDADRGYIHNWGFETFNKDKNFIALKILLKSNFGQKMIDRIREIVLATNMNDIHSRNFGYDKNGKLKVLDLY